MQLLLIIVNRTNLQCLFNIIIALHFYSIIQLLMQRHWCQNAIKMIEQIAILNLFILMTTSETINVNLIATQNSSILHASTFTEKPTQDVQGTNKGIAQSQTYFIQGPLSYSNSSTSQIHPNNFTPEINTYQNYGNMTLLSLINGEENETTHSANSSQEININYNQTNSSIPFSNKNLSLSSILGQQQSEMQTSTNNSMMGANDLQSLENQLMSLQYKTSSAGLQYFSPTYFPTNDQTDSDKETGNALTSVISQDEPETKSSTLLQAMKNSINSKFSSIFSN